MLSVNYTEQLLGIKDANILAVENDSKNGIKHIYFELNKDIHECPQCKELMMAIHDYRWQPIKGPPLGSEKALFSLPQAEISMP